MRNFRIWMALGIILLAGISLPLKADYGSDDRLTTESLRDLYTVTENLELGVEPMYRLTGSAKIDNIKWYNLTMNHIMNVNTSFKISLGYMSYQVIQTSTAETVGEVRNIMFRPTITQSLVPYNRRFTPYLGGGLNFYRSFDEKAMLPGQKMWLHRDYAWGAHLATGIRFLPRENMMISIDIFRDWMFSKVRVSRSLTGRSFYDPTGKTGRLPPSSVNLNMWAYGLNFSFRF